MICHLRLVRAIAIGLITTVVIIACSGGGDPPATGSNPGGTEREITEEDLSLMVLSQDELGPEYSFFSLDPGASGFSTNNDEIADEECEPNEERADIERYGRLNGYDSSYSSDQQIEARSGVFLVSTEVDLLEDPAGAVASFEDGSEETRQDVGVPDCEGFTKFSLDEFSTSSIGERSSGFVATLGGEEVRFYATAVAFLRGPLNAAVFVGDFDPTDHRVEVEVLARKLDERIQAVLREEVSAGTDDTPPPRAAMTREQALDLLPQLVLLPEDIPPGLETADSGLETLDDIASLADDPARSRRLLESWEFVLGYLRQYAKDRPDGIFDLGVEVWALADEDNAEEAFIDGALLSNFPDAQYEELPNFPAFGEDSVAERLTGEQTGPDGTSFQAEEYDVLIRVNNFLAVLVTTSPEGQTSQAEVEALAAALEARMRASQE